MSPAPLTPEQLAELLEKSVEIDLDALMEGDLDATTGMFMSNLMKEAGTPASERTHKSGEPTSDNSTGAGEGEEPLMPIVTVYYYDEWDFRAQDYKPRWCAVKESKLEEGDDNFYEDTLREHAGLVAADPQAVRADEAGDVPQDQAAARRRGLRPRRGDRVDGRAPQRRQPERERSTGAATRSSATSPSRS